MDGISAAKPVYSAPDNSAIDCEVTFAPGANPYLPEGGTVPFTASRHDPEPHGRAIYEMIVASGVAIGAYVEPAGLPDNGALPTKLA